MSSDPPDPPDRPEDAEERPSVPADELDLDDVDVRDLLRKALEPPKEDAAKIRTAVHTTLRDRSGGRFFADGWSTQSAPVLTFLVTSLLMLAVVVALWLLLGPLL